ncbi:hypothetical protein GCM10010182_66640 [Actinomadura cremea]|nr:hypothetical protein GCM10010182_66640 [Actinomadura cremea]
MPVHLISGPGLPARPAAFLVITFAPSPHGIVAALVITVGIRWNARTPSPVQLLVLLTDEARHGTAPATRPRKRPLSQAERRFVAGSAT